MTRLLISAVTALLIAAPSIAGAETGAQPSGSQPSQSSSETRTLTDVRIDVVKNALQLTPEQMKYWPAIEEAIRARAEARRTRIEDTVSRAKEGDIDRDFVKVMQQRAENLSERASGLKKLADAWQPLYGTLTDAQKRRMRILGFVVLHRLEERVEARRMQMEDEDRWEGATGAGSGESGSGAQ